MTTFGALVQVKLFAGILKVAGSIDAGKAKSKFVRRAGNVNLEIYSTKVFPMQMRWPPKKGEKE